MATLEKVTVDKAYFDALLRRADFHTSAQLLSRPDPVNVTISRVEYDSLLRVSREYDLLKTALFQGGISSETLDILVSDARSNNQRHDSGVESMEVWTQDLKGGLSMSATNSFQRDAPAPHRDGSGRSGLSGVSFNLASKNRSFQNGSLQSEAPHLRVPKFQRHASCGMSSAPDDIAFDDVESLDGGNQLITDFGGIVDTGERRTVYLSGFSERTTYRDLLSVIKGGKLLSVNLRSERSATVTFFEGAADFMAWAKRNDIYLKSKRIDIKYADRQYRLNGHIANKMANGATRNLVIQSAVEKGLTEFQIREDMEHVDKLVIIDINFYNGDAYVATNSVHNALFARTCMMSRSAYKGCKIKFSRDECDVPLPVRTYVPRTAAATGPKKKPPINNRFDMLNIDGGGSDVENRTPSEHDSEDQTTDGQPDVGVSLTFMG